MSLFSRLFGRSPPAPPAAPDRAPPAREETRARPDTSALAQAEEASVSQAIAAADRVAVGKWVLEGNSTRVRQMAARAVTDPEQLGPLIRAVRGKDKNVYRILTGKRDELLAQERAAQQRQAEVAAAAEAVARHVDRALDAAYEGTLGRLETRWHAVAADATPELRSEVARQVEQARSAVEAHRRATEVESERRRAAALAEEEGRRQREQDAELAAADEAADEAEQARRVAEERDAERAKRDAEAAQVRDLVGLLRQAQAALEQGGTARATRLRDAIRDKLAQAPALPLPAWFERKLQDADARIEELRDWRTFTVVPKRGELVQRMESLVGAEMSPEELARQIRRLRDEWRTVNRGAGEESAPERERFEQAAQRAYEPCREHFARQAELRQQNQARRETLLERLAAFAATQATGQPDVRTIRQVLVEARGEWGQYAPVDQDAVKPLQARFHALLDELRGRLEGEYSHNVQAKRDLIARAAALVALEDMRAAIEETKVLQRAWKSIGPVPHRQDESLWSEFRQHCDAVFQRSSQAYAAYAATLEANQVRAMALCEELERLAGADADAPAAGSRQIADLGTEFDTLELPRSSARELRQRFARAAECHHEAQHRRRAATARRAWVDTFAAAARVRAYALALVQSPSGPEAATLRASAEAAVAALEHAPREARNVLERQLASLGNGEPGADTGANESRLRLLCVRAELIAGVESPPEDRELRREYQMRRLVESMGGGERRGPGDLQGLTLEWLATGPVEPATHDALFERFERCLNVGEK